VAAADATGLPLYERVADVADCEGVTLPVPFLDVIEGGELAATDLDFQEHQLVPTGAGSFAEAIRMGAEVYYELGDRLAESYGRSSRNVGVEGGYTPPGMTDPREAFDAMLGAAEECGYGGSFALAVDAAATHFHDAGAGTYSLTGEPHTPGEMIDVYADLASAYPLESIEDPLDEADFGATAELTGRVDAQIVGDDLFVTNADRVERGIDAGAADALLFKINQVGTVTGAFDAAATAREGGYAVQVSERSGQTPDTWLADVAVGLDAGQIKTGVTRGERTEQYNRLLRIEERLGTAGTYGDWPPTP
jgi:enolase